MRIFYLAAFILFTALCVFVAISNRAIVGFSLDPLPFAWDMPVYLIFFVGIFIGLGAGAIVVLSKTIKQSHLNRKQNKKIRDLEKQVEALSPQEASLPDQESP